MFRELAYITTMLSAAALGTEIIFRFHPKNRELGQAYELQSNIIVAVTATEFIGSLIFLRSLKTLSKLQAKILMLFVLAALVTAIAFRSKFGYFKPTDTNRYNVYNATSFFITAATIAWIGFWFFRRESRLADPEFSLSETQGGISREQGYQEGQDNSTNSIGVNPLLLPSYSELPPPSYDATNSSSKVEEAQNKQNENTSTLAAESSSQNYDSNIPESTHDRNINIGTVNETNENKAKGICADQENPSTVNAAATEADNSIKQF